MNLLLALFSIVYLQASWEPSSIPIEGMSIVVTSDSLQLHTRYDYSTEAIPLFLSYPRGERLYVVQVERDASDTTQTWVQLAHDSNQDEMERFPFQHCPQQSHFTIAPCPAQHYGKNPHSHHSPGSTMLVFHDAQTRLGNILYPCICSTVPDDHILYAMFLEQRHTAIYILSVTQFVAHC